MVSTTMQLIFAVITLLTFLLMNVLLFSVISLLPECGCVRVIGCRCVLLSE